MLVRYRSWAHRPPRHVHARLLDRDGATMGRLEGVYRDTTWVFDLPDDRSYSAVTLVLDEQTVLDPPLPRSAGPVDLDEDTVRFPEPDISVDEGRLQRTWFDQGERDLDLWDLVVVGTGIGGGVLLSALNHRLDRSNGDNLSVLGLEAGSMLFPGHVGNLPRVLYPPPAAAGAGTLWSSLHTFGSRPYQLDGSFAQNGRPDALWGGYEMFALGGRSLYWGGLCPPLDDHELARWPAPVANELRPPDGSASGYYAQAEALLGVDHPQVDELERDTLRLLGRLLPDRDTRLAPIALRRQGRRSWGVPGGLFSTAELLLEQRLAHAAADQSFGRPYLHLAEPVVAVEQQPDRTWLVHGVDLRDGSRTMHRARRVVLSAGTVETPRIVTASGLPNAPDGVGKYYTEHPMAYMWFQIPAGNAYCRSRSSVNLLSYPGSTGTDWNVQVQLGSDAILDHAVPPGWQSTASAVAPGAVAGQLVFLGRADLDATGRLEFGPRPWLHIDPDGPLLPEVTLHPATAKPPDEWHDVTALIIGALGAEPLSSHNSGLITSNLGSVAHEVGTMRMGSDSADAVVSENLEVFGCDGLFVCDNSVLPTSPAANPSLTLAALALRLADHLWATR